MNLLAFDTACDACSVALWRDGAVIARRAQAMTRGQSEALVPMIDETMREARARFADLAAVAVTVGPGAFTGLRIGLASARAIALAAGCPAIGVTTFEALAGAAARLADRPLRNLMVAIDTKRGDLYLQGFVPDESATSFIAYGDPAVLDAAAARAILPPGRLWLAGDGAASLQSALGRGEVHAIIEGAALPDAADVAAIAARRLTAGTPQTPLRPLYLRPPAVRLPAASTAPEAVS